MQSTQHSLCRVLLHPACTSNPDAIRAVQQATGRLVVVNGGKPKLMTIPVTGLANALRSLPLGYQLAFIDESDSDPFGGDAA